MMLWLALFVPIICAVVSIALDLRCIRQAIDEGFWHIERIDNDGE